MKRFTNWINRIFGNKNISEFVTQPNYDSEGNRIEYIPVTLTKEQAKSLRELIAKNKEEWDRGIAEQKIKAREILEKRSFIADDSSTASKLISRDFINKIK